MEDKWGEWFDEATRPLRMLCYPPVAIEMCNEAYSEDSRCTGNDINERLSTAGTLHTPRIGPL